jgi:NAD(P)-dependent dehydrogenase (short-subunit alcohol dehydrogenase family)
MKKTMFITGASSGLGKATALFFAHQGWNVVATMRDPTQEQELASHSNILIASLEVGNPAAIAAAVAAGIARFGQIDVLVNNAGYGQQGVFEAMSPEKIREQFDVNVFGLMNVTRAVLPHFRSRQQGTVVNISSGAGRVTTPLLSVYSASKFAVEGFSEALAFELKSQHIRVKIVEPGYVATKFYERAAADFAADAALTDYDAFQGEMATLFASFAGADTATAEDVARTVYAAATDGTDTLRYLIGPDIEPMMAVRNSRPDQEYVEFTRGLFMPHAFQQN